MKNTLYGRREENDGNGTAAFHIEIIERTNVSVHANK